VPSGREAEGHDLLQCTDRRYPGREHMLINTRALADRRLLRFASVAEILADLDRLEAAERLGTLRALGNWPPGSIFDHLGRAAVCSFDGFDGFTFPFWLRACAPLVKRRMLNRSFPIGFKLSKDGESKAWRPDVAFDQGLAFYREQLARIEPAGSPSPGLTQRHPSFGFMMPRDWVLYHLRHAELHLGFLKP